MTIGERTSAAITSKPMTMIRRQGHRDFEREYSSVG
jgi:hypothetical protein